MTTAPTTTVSAAGQDNHIRMLVGGEKWGAGAGTGVSLTYSFYQLGASTYSYSGAPTASPFALSGAMVTAIQNALAAWGAVADITFNAVSDTSSSSGVLRFGGSADPSTAYAYYPSQWAAQGGDVWFGNAYRGLSTVSPTTYYYGTIVHEIGHALGLKHPHEGDYIATADDSIQYSVMSYRDYIGDSPGNGYSSSHFYTTPMIADIEAIQFLYGANRSYRTGNDVYSWSTGARIFQTVWDAGGTDTVSWSNQATSATIDLNAGSYSKLGPAVNYAGGSNPYTFGIAKGVTIENAIGGSAADTLIGNGVGNSLQGNDGDDTLTGGAGDDSLDGGAGSDTAVFSGSQSAYTVLRTGGGASYQVVGADGKDVLTGIEFLKFGTGSAVAIDLLARWFAVTAGNDAVTGTDEGDLIEGLAGNDTLLGGSGDDTLTGDIGNDSLDGGAGADGMSGGAGNDIFVVDDAGDVVTEVRGGGVDLILSSITWSLAALPEIEQLRLIGSDAIDATGNALANVITGNDGNNVLDGGVGSDVLQGGNGDDAYAVDGTGDRVIEVAGGGADTVVSQVAYVLPVEVENLTLGGAGAIAGTGNALANAITGNAAANILTGLAGDDTLTGGGGADVFVYAASGNGTDTITDFAVGDLIRLTTTLSGAVGAGDGSSLGNGRVEVQAGDGVTRLLIGNNNTPGADLVINLTGAFDAGAFGLIGRDIALVGASGGTLTGGAAADSVNGTGGADTLDGLAGNDYLRGFAGNDSLDGGLGSDILEGGNGDDAYAVDGTGDRVIETAGGGTDTVVSQVAYVLPVEVENLTLGGAGAIAGTGNALANAITGNAAANILTGLAGDDTLTGGGGADVFVYAASGNGTDTITDFAVGDLIRLTATLTGAVGAGDGSSLGNGRVEVQAGDGVTRLLIGNNNTPGADLVINLTGAFDAGAFGLIGRDIALVGASGGTLTGGAAADSVNGTGGADTLDGLAGNDYLRGFAGNDSLDGGAGSDILEGGNGDDAYAVDGTGDRVIEVAGGGTDTVVSQVAYVLPVEVENLTLGGAGAIAGTGNALANAITGNAAANILTGLAGDDTLTGGGGADVFVYAASGNGTDTITDFAVGDLIRLTTTLSGAVGAGDGSSLGNGRVEVQAGDGVTRLLIGNNNTPGADLVINLTGAFDAGAFGLIGRDIALVGTSGGTLTGGAAADSVNGTGGADTLDGLAGNDYLRGFAGNDSLDGGAGSDILEGGSGDDVYAVDGTGDRVIEVAGGGTDTVVSQVAYVLPVEVENLTLGGAGAIAGTGNALANAITGNAAANILTGLAGDDTLTGGGGRDLLSGGLGCDTFVFTAATDSTAGVNRDVITDFTIGADILDLTAIDADGNAGNGDTAFTFLGVDAAFAGIAGELRFLKFGSLLQADVDGDGSADFEIGLGRLATFSADGLLL